MEFPDLIPVFLRDHLRKHALCHTARYGLPGWTVRWKPGRDHILGNPTADITLLEFGSYDCPYCHAAHEVIAELRDKFGDRMRYVFRQRPITGSDAALEAAELAEYAARDDGRFWEVHDALMKRGPVFNPGDFEEIAAEFELPAAEARQDAKRNAASKVRSRPAERAAQRRRMFTPTFFINSRRYEGAWDRSSLSDAMLGSLGHRIQSADGRLPALGAVGGVAASADVGGGDRDREFAGWCGVRRAVGNALRTRDSARTRWRCRCATGSTTGFCPFSSCVVGLEIKREFTVGRLEHATSGRAS